MALADGLILHSPQIVGELSTFVEKETGKLEAEEGCFDDAVIGLAMAMVGFNRAAMLLSTPKLKVTEVPEPFSLDAIVDELRGRDHQFPISPQAETIH